MRAIDTNIVVRAIVRDDPVQADAARAVLAQPCFIAHTVWLEAGWVLRSAYRLERKAIARAFTALLQSPTVSSPREAALRWAFDRHARVGTDLGDLLHLAGLSGTVDRFATFDTTLARAAGAASPVAIETLR